MKINVPRGIINRGIRKKGRIRFKKKWKGFNVGEEIIPASAAVGKMLIEEGYAEEIKELETSKEESSIAENNEEEKVKSSKEKTDKGKKSK